MFAQVVSNCPADKAAVLMKTRCKQLLSTQLPPDWDGVFVHELK